MKTYKITHGQTDTICDHYSSCHNEDWRKEVIDGQLKGWEKLCLKNGTVPGPSQSPNATPPEPFTREALHRRIVQWIAHDDQVSCLSSVPYIPSNVSQFAGPQCCREPTISGAPHLHKYIANRTCGCRYPPPHPREHYPERGVRA